MDQLPATSYQLLTPGRGRALTVMLGIAALIGIAREGSAQQLTPQIRYSTHDWTRPIAGGGEDSIDFREAWADVKTTGDGFAYAVGTITVATTQPGSLFSNSSASDSAPAFGPLTGTAVRQVAILQKTLTVDAPPAVAQDIDEQRFFHGTTPGLLNSLRASNARGISVWPADTEADTRVVICGEVYDQSVPQSQALAGFPFANGNNATGFIAVYDGALNLRWTHHFFGTNAAGECAVTDISVRVVGEAGNERDVITYCGISTFGSPAAGNASLTPVRPFVAPAPLCGAGSRAWANGNDDNGVGQWDGFVGQLSRAHTALGPTAVEFHSVVGGSQQDGLFGIAELDEGLIAVVGSSAGVAASAGLACPGVCVLATDVYCVGTMLLFDSDLGPTSGPLVLESYYQIGSPGEFRTIARDVHAQPEDGWNRLFVVGSTDDDRFVGVNSNRQTAFAGPTDGYIGYFALYPGVPPILTSSVLDAIEYQGLAGNSGYTGVQAWNEFGDHAVVTGFVEEAGFPDTYDIDVASYYYYSGGYSAPPTVAQFRLLTRGQLMGDTDDRPTAMGQQELISSSAVPAFQTFQLGNPAGGGVTQDASGRVQVVGRTRSLTYATTGASARPRATTLTPPGIATLSDGVRSVVDLLPVGVGRTDGTGSPPRLAGLTFPRPNTDGGTTPTCDLEPFGRQIGTAVPNQLRMLIAYEGPPPAVGGSAGIVVCRTPGDGTVALAAVQIGFPGTTAFNPVLLYGMEVWVPGSVVSTFYLAAPSRAFHVPISPLPLGGQYTVQVAFGVLSPVLSGNEAANVPCLTAQSDLVVASPGLYLDY